MSSRAPLKPAGSLVSLAESRGSACVFGPVPSVCVGLWPARMTMTTPTTTKGVERDGLCESCDATHRKDGGGCFGFFFFDVWSRSILSHVP